MTEHLLPSWVMHSMLVTDGLGKRGIRDTRSLDFNGQAIDALSPLQYEAQRGMLRRLPLEQCVLAEGLLYVGGGVVRNQSLGRLYNSAQRTVSS